MQKICWGGGYEKSAIRRYIKLEMNFLFVYICVVLTSFLGINLVDTYGEGAHFFVYGIVDAMGLATLFNTPTINPTWWYMSLAVLLVFAVPVLIWLYEKFGVISTILTLLLPYALRITDASFFAKYIGMAAVGVWFAKENILEKCKSRIFLKSETITIYIKLFMVIFMMRIFCVIRFNVETFIEPMNYLIALVCIYFCYDFIADIKVFSTIFECIGRYSMNIFLVHTVFYARYLMEFIYSFKYSVLVVGITLLVSLAASVLIEKLKTFLRYDKLTDWICGKVIRENEGVLS